jgi:hypothetical protein
VSADCVVPFEFFDRVELDIFRAELNPDFERFLVVIVDDPGDFSISL